ncbi:MAG TPA: Tn3 family transposase [Ignavibacteria bacterium]
MVILHNVIDIINALKKLNDDDVLILRKDIENLSPYMTIHIKRFGEYVIDLIEIPEPIIEIDIEEIIESIT